MMEQLHIVHATGFWFEWKLSKSLQSIQKPDGATLSVRFTQTDFPQIMFIYSFACEACGNAVQLTTTVRNGASMCLNIDW